MNKVEHLITTNLVNNPDEINQISKFKKGYLNDNYLVELKNNQNYVIRICKPNKLVNRQQEYAFMEAINFASEILYYDTSTGNYIRRYYHDKIKAKSSKCYTYLHQIIKKIAELHSYKQIQAINCLYDFEMYVDLKKDCNDPFYLVYKQIITNLKNNHNLKLCLSHNDLNPANILATEKGVNFIDYEFSCLNYDYFDYGYFFKEIFLKNKTLIKLSKQYHWDYQWMLSFIYLTTYISYAWSLQMPQTKAIMKYQKQMSKRLKYYFRILKKQTN